MPGRCCNFDECLEQSAAVRFGDIEEIVAARHRDMTAMAKTNVIRALACAVTEQASVRHNHDVAPAIRLRAHILREVFP